MSANFQVVVKKSNGNLHIHPSGDFDGSSAWELVSLLQDKYDGNGQVIIETNNLLEICPFGCSTFQYQLNLSRVPADRLAFKGKRGREIAPEGSKVILDSDVHSFSCSGDCVNCSCSKNNQN